MDRKDLTATSFLTSRLFAFVLVVVGLLFVFQPDALGWAALSRFVGGETSLVAVGVGCAFFLLAALALEKDKLRVRCAELMEALHQLLYGKDYRRDREAIEVLLAALESGDKERAQQAHGHLVRLTGQNLAADPRVWRAWWSANERHFGLDRVGGPGAAGSVAADEAEGSGPEGNGPEGNGSGEPSKTE